jgi:hypothetical protein
MRWFVVLPRMSWRSTNCYQRSKAAAALKGKGPGYPVLSHRVQGVPDAGPSWASALLVEDIAFS